MKFYCCAERELKPDGFSQLIMDVIKADYSHVFILVEDMPLDLRVRYNLPLEGDVIYEATTPRYTRDVLRTKNRAGSEIKEKIEIKVFNEFAAVAWMQGNMGKSYSLSQCWIIAYPELAKEYENGEGSGFCSEFCIRFVYNNMIDQSLISSFNLETIDPKECIHILKKLE